MDCPVCKYPNPQGATHCGMCYEVFNRSAADAYMRAMKRERLKTEGPPVQKSAPSSGEMTQKIVELTERVDWARVKASLFSAFMRSRTALAIILSLIALWMLGGWFFSPALWYHITGKKLSYAFSAGEPDMYLVGMTEKIRSWSELGGRLDTPLEEFQVDEYGNLSFHPEKSAVKNRIPVRLIVKEWIQILHDDRQSSGSGIPLSHTIPLRHPSLAASQVIVDKKGVLVERRPTLSARVGKALPFLAPKLPAGTIRRGMTWTEPVEWMDIYNDWKIRWVGTFHWTAGELAPCVLDTCVQLTYKAELRPQLWAAPPWASKAVRFIEPQISTEGVALFDAGHRRLASNTFSYEGMLHIPLRDLGFIPRDLRIGRRLKKTPGEVVIRFENKVDLHKN